jgi:hypothetical protein
MEAWVSNSLGPSKSSMNYDDMDKIGSRLKSPGQNNIGDRIALSVVSVNFDGSSIDTGKLMDFNTAGSGSSMEL